MEKLKVKHDHKLTDIIKIGIFALFLILPILMFLPSCLYYGFNEHATAPTTTEENKDLVNFNQLFNYKEDTTNQYISSTFNNGLITVNVNNTSGTNQYLDLSELINFKRDHEYYFHVYPTNTFNGLSTQMQLFFDISQYQYLYINVNRNYILQRFDFDISRRLRLQTDTSFVGTLSFYYEVIDFSQLFGVGNEPTIQEFNVLFPNNYYDYTQSDYIYVNNGTTSEYIDISKNIYFAWQSIWNKPILEWTGINNFNFTINAFTNIFGITKESYIANYITYLMTLLVIYIVFDIVIMVFTKLTHLFNE